MNMKAIFFQSEFKNVHKELDESLNELSKLNNNGNKIERVRRSIFEKNFDNLSENEIPDVVFVPTISEYDNAANYSGIEFALHWYFYFISHTKPFAIIILSSEDKSAFYDHCDYSTFLKCPNVYFIQNNFFAIEQFLEKNPNPAKEFSKQDCISALKNIGIKAPTSYKSHHSIANEWAVLRWCEMFGFTEKIPKDDLKHLLYFKYINALSNKNRENFRPKDKKEFKCKCKINDIDNKTIVYIDDEHDKGWSDLLKDLVEKESKGKFVCYKGFSKDDNKETRIRKINAFIDKQDKADCYIIDLRLHDDDFVCEFEDISGFEVIKYIKDKNEANQVVVFTASNKTWNEKRALENGANYYVIKESPEFTYSRDESYKLYCQFSKAVTSAVNKSYQKEIVSKINTFVKKDESNNKLSENLESFKDLLVFNDENPAVNNALILLLLNIIEYFCKINYRIDGNFLYKD